MSQLPILYTFRRCPYAMRARMALAAAQIVFEAREILLKNKPKSMLQFSPKGTVPVLVLTDGSVIDESLDVMLWALQQKGGLDYFPQTIADKNFAFEQIRILDQDFKKNLDICKYHVRYTEIVFEKAKKQAFELLNSWNKILETQEYFHGDKFGFLDMALLPFVRQFSGIKPDLFFDLNVPKLKKWLKQGLESELFSEVMQKYSLWEDSI